MQGTIDRLTESFRVYLPHVLGALVILIIGWIVAAIISGVVRSAVRRTGIGERLGRLAGQREGASSNAHGVAGTAVFWLIMLFVLVAAFQTLQLTLITQPLTDLLNLVFAYLPRLIGAAILVLIAWIVARILRTVVTRLLQAANIDQRLSGAPAEAQPLVAGSTARLQAPPPPPLSQTLGEVVYWLVFLLFLPAILSALQLPGILVPVQSLLNRVLAFIPNIVAAGLILLVGWFVAGLVQRIVTGLLAGIGVDRLSERVGLAEGLGSRRLSGVLGLVVYVFIIIPVAIAALNALNLDAVSAPASNMLNTLLAAIPRIFAAILTLVIAYVVARVVSRLVTDLLEGFGFDRILPRLGFSRPAAPGERTLSQVAGQLLLVAIMLFAAIEASQVLGFILLATLIVDFTRLAGHILLGVIIFAIGLYLANQAARLVRESNVEQAGLLALGTRIAILVLSGAMALRQMGIANDIINLAFGLLLGAIAVAAAVAFGIGGREVARRQLERWTRTVEPSQLVPPTVPGADILDRP
ncbi:MAG: mechanosensitive ion channel [Dehalococcoidia bacterium]